MTLALEEDIRRAQKHGAVEAIVSRDVSSQSSPMFVKLVGFSRKLEFGPCPWGPPFYEVGNDIVTPILPNKGDRCIAVPTDDPHVYWIPCYWPFAL